jgi:hypothetical protein
MLVNFEGIAIVPVKTILRAKPHKSVMVLQHRKDCALRKPLLGADTPEGKALGKYARRYSPHLDTAQQHTQKKPSL